MIFDFFPTLCCVAKYVACPNGVAVPSCTRRPTFLHMCTSYHDSTQLLAKHYDATVKLKCDVFDMMSSSHCFFLSHATLWSNLTLKLWLTAFHEATVNTDLQNLVSFP